MFSFCPVIAIEILEKPKDLESRKAEIFANAVPKFQPNTLYINMCTCGEILACGVNHKMPLLQILPKLCYLH